MSKKTMSAATFRKAYCAGASLAIIVLLFGCASANSAKITVSEFTLKNNTGETITEVYASPAFSDYRGYNLLGEASAPILEGQERIISLKDVFFSRYYDVFCIDQYGNEYTIYGVNFAKSHIIYAEENSEDTPNENELQ